MNYEPLQDWTGRAKRSHPSKKYICVYVPEHPRAFRISGEGEREWVYEHRLVAEASLGRILECGESVHHINEIKHDNRLCNLFVCDVEEHNKAHGWRLSFG